MSAKRAIVLIDGEHYPPVVKEAIELLRQEHGLDILGACFLGGIEKIGAVSDFQLALPLISGKDYLCAIRETVQSLRPEVAVDLSDEPVVGYEERMEIASLLASLGVDYLGSDFMFKAPKFPVLLEKPTLGIIGTGKRVGKTAISANTARIIKEMNYRPVVVAMGRGGPKEPVLLDGETILIDNKFLMELKDSGKHASSDYVEDAMMSRVLTVGCRRCGGGMLGLPFVSNVSKGIDIAKKLNVDIILLEGSGSAMPPVKANRYLTVSSLIEPENHIIGFLGTFRIYISSILVLTNCEGNEEKKLFEKVSKSAKERNPDLKIVGTVFRPRALESLKGEKIFLATTTPQNYLKKVKGHLEETENCEVVFASSHLSNRARLKEEIDVKGKDVTAVVMELKAASVDVALDFALTNGKRAVFFDNIPHTVVGDMSLEELIIEEVQELIKH